MVTAAFALLPVRAKSFSRVRLFVARQAPLFMGLSRQAQQSEFPCPLPGDLPNPGMEPEFLSPALAGEFFLTSATWEALS